MGVRYFEMTSVGSHSTATKKEGREVGGKKGRKEGRKEGRIFNHEPTVLGAIA